MSDSIADLLKNRSYDEPEESLVIKSYLQEKFKSGCIVALQPHQIIITVSSAALAGTLRMHLTELQARLQTKKRLIIRIGS